MDYNAGIDRTPVRVLNIFYEISFCCVLCYLDRYPRIYRIFFLSKRKNRTDVPITNKMCILVRFFFLTLHCST